MDDVFHYPWSVLELDPAGATERDVKRAYARLIKIHRPDTDIQGFRAVHDAYQAALEFLRVEEAPEYHPISLTAEKVPALPPMAEQPAPPLPTQQVPALLLALLQNLFAAIEIGATDKINPAYEALHRHLEASPSDIPNLDLALLDHLTQFPDHGAKFLTPERLIWFICKQSYHTAHACIAHWHRKDRGELLGEFLRSFVQHAPLNDRAETIQFYLHLAEVGAFIHAKDAVTLVNRIFPLLSPAEREHRLASADERTKQGTLFSILPLEDRLFWEKQIFPPVNPVQVPEKTMWRYFRRATRHAPASWPGWVLITQIGPPKLARKIAGRIRPRVCRYRFLRLRQTEWQHIPARVLLKRLIKELFSHLLKIGGILVAVIGLVASIVYFAYEKPPAPVVATPLFLPLPAEDSLPEVVSKMHGKYDLNKLSEISRKLHKELEADPEYKKWKADRSQKSPPEPTQSRRMELNHLDQLIHALRHNSRQ